MGVNKVPETGHTQILTRPHEQKSKFVPDTRQGLGDKLSVKGGALKHSRSTGGGSFRTNSVKLDGLNASSAGGIKSDKSNVDTGFRWESRDDLTGCVFSDLAKEGYKKGRPYCFAVAIVTTEKTPGKKKSFMDGSELIQSVDVDAFEIPYDINLHSGEAAVLYDVSFFSARENRPIEKISSINEIIGGTNSMILQRLVKPEDNKVYASVGYVTDILISSAYFFGIGVKRDQEYAKKIMPKLGKEEKEELSPDIFAFALACGKDTRLAELLLDNGFDPRVRDPYEGTTSIQEASCSHNEEMLRMFEKYGYHLEK